ncbi:MAG TPA: Do family serine endopeptidase [Flavisolibacter sp.]|jgi:Do/DeqQ family serine protease|nr:Do family serine endopeptidase [Flavisolibacter sp.]
MTIKQSLTTGLLVAATALGSIWGYDQMQQRNEANLFTDNGLFKTASYVESPLIDPGVDFEKAATKAVPAVVHIKTASKAKQVAAPRMENNPFRDFFGDGFEDMFGGRQSAPQVKRGSGSGVIITGDGYIVTNNHVVDGADELMVTLSNNKSYKGKVVGTDPSSDLAVVKIEATNLSYLTFANSDDVRLGQWVLAIGYPLNLDATVTSGIVSAKARSIGINSRQSKTPLEAFIQTDAAINPGNSGGALVNTNGDLIGINSAIASPTGSYAGYGYAIPSNMVNKIAADIIKYGSTKRAYLGVMFGNGQSEEEQAKSRNVDGVYIVEVSKGSAADEAGMQKGDVITKLNGAKVTTGTQIIEKIAAMRPGEKVAVSYNRNGAEKTVSLTLKGEAGTYASLTQGAVEQLGASFENLSKEKAAQLGLTGGVEIKSLKPGILSEQTRIREGFIVTKVNGKKVASTDELKTALQSAGSSAIISGVYPGQPQREYQYALNDLR